MDAERIAEIRARVDAATPGPWGVWSSMDNTLDVLSEATQPAVPLLSFYGNDQPLPSLQEKRNAEFVAAARTDVPDLLSALDAARADVARLRFGLEIVERNTADELIGHGSNLLRVCRVCDQVGEQGHIPHAPDCPFAALAATEAQP